MLQGFKDTSSKCRHFIQDMGALAVTFFAQAKEIEDGLDKCVALAFLEAMNASKGHICGLVEEVANAEDTYAAAEAKFDKIVAMVAKEIKEFVRLKGGRTEKRIQKAVPGSY